MKRNVEQEARQEPPRSRRRRRRRRRNDDCRVHSTRPQRRHDQWRGSCEHDADQGAECERQVGRLVAAAQVQVALLAKQSQDVRLLRQTK